jgi:hypothetical protein
MGYLFVDIAVLGPNDELILHTISRKEGGTKENAIVPAKVKQFGHVI